MRRGKVKRNLHRGYPPQIERCVSGCAAARGLDRDAVPAADLDETRAQVRALTEIRGSGGTQVVPMLSCGATTTRDQAALDLFWL